MWNSQLIRPAQDCSLGYGCGLSFLKVKILTRDNYEEELVQNIKPLWHEDYVGMHTFNFCDNLSVIDTQKKIDPLEIDKNTLKNRHVTFLQ